MYHNKKKNWKKIWQQRKLRIWRRKVIILEGFGLKISIFENLKNMIFSRSEITFRYQISIPEPSDMVRELKDSNSDE